MPGFPYVLTNQSGERVASAENIEDALFLLRVIPSAKHVIRHADGKDIELARTMPARSRVIPMPRRWAV